MFYNNYPTPNLSGGYTYPNPAGGVTYPNPAGGVTYPNPTAHYAPGYPATPYPAATAPQAPPDARANVPAYGAGVTQAAATMPGQSPWNYGGAGASQLGPQGPSFAGGGYPQMAMGAGATPFGGQAPSQPQAGVEQQMAQLDYRMTAMANMMGGQPGAPMGHDFLASVISPEPAVPNNYLGGIVNG